MGSNQLGLGMVECDELAIHLFSRNLKEIERKLLERYSIDWRPKRGTKDGNVLIERIVESLALLRSIGKENGWNLLDKPKPDPYWQAFKAVRELQELRGELTTLHAAYYSMRQREPMSSSFWTDAARKKCQDMGKNFKRREESFYPSTMHAIRMMRAFEEFIYSNPEFVR